MSKKQVQVITIRDRKELSMPKMVSELIKKLRMEYPALREEPMLDELEAAAYGEEDMDEMPEDELDLMDLEGEEEPELPELEDEELMLPKKKRK